MLNLFQVRDQQLRALQKARGGPLARKLEEFVRRTEKPDCDDRILARTVDMAVSRGVDIGFTTESSYLAYALLGLRLGTRFDEHPAIAAILNDRATPPDHRLARLAEEISAEVWEAAALLSGTPPIALGVASGVER